MLDAKEKTLIEQNGIQDVLPSEIIYIDAHEFIFSKKRYDCMFSFHCLEICIFPPGIM